MYNLIVKGSELILEHQVPIIEGGFGEGERTITAKTVAELHKMTVGDVNKLIGNSSITLDEGYDFLDIVEMVRDDNKLRESLNLSLRDVNKATKHFYILSEPGYMKLVFSMKNSNETKWQVMNSFISEYFRMRSNLEKIAGKFLTASEVNKILNLASKNEYIKLFTKPLVPPRGNKGSLFKRNEINPFIGKIGKEVEQYLVESLGVPDINHIPSIAHRAACMLVEDFYTLSDELRNECDTINNKLRNLRIEVIDESKAKNAEKRKLFEEEYFMLKQVIRGLLK